MDFSDIELRTAAAGDLPKIREIGDNIYEGLDYLPVRYEEYLESPNHFMYLAKDSEKMLAFCVLWLTDSGRTVVEKAVRTHQAVRSHGIYRLLKDYAYKHILKLHPTIIRTRMTSDKSEYWQEKLNSTPNMTVQKKCVTIGLLKLSEDEVLAMNSSLSAPSISSDVDRVCIRWAVKEDIELILNDGSTRLMLFPENIILTEYDPFEADLANISQFVRPYNWCFLEVNPDASNDSQTSKIRSLTVATLTSACAIGMRLLIAYYGDASSQTLRAHIARHLQELPRFFRGVGIIRVDMLMDKEDCDLSEVRNAVKTFKGAIVENDPLEFWVMEKPL